MTHPYEVQLPDGTIYRVTSLAEMVELRRMLALEPQPPPTATITVPAVVVTSSNTDIGWKAIFDELLEDKHDEELRILTILKGVRKPILTANIMRALGWDQAQTGQLGARIAGIGRICRRAGISSESLLIREGNHKSGITYRAGSMLLKNELPPVPQGAR